MLALRQMRLLNKSLYTWIELVGSKIKYNLISAIIECPKKFILEHKNTKSGCVFYRSHNLRKTY